AKLSDLECLPYLKRAVELDPDFAYAHTALAVAYWNQGERDLANRSIARAYELRSRVSRRERFHIEGFYFDLVSGELERAHQLMTEWAKAYPNDSAPFVNMGDDDRMLGQYDRALTETREACRIDSNNAVTRANLVQLEIAVGVLDDAERDLAESLDTRR